MNGSKVTEGGKDLNLYSVEIDPHDINGFIFAVNLGLNEVFLEYIVTGVDVNAVNGFGFKALSTVIRK